MSKMRCSTCGHMFVPDTYKAHRETCRYYPPSVHDAILYLNSHFTKRDHDLAMVEELMQVLKLRRFQAAEIVKAWREHA